MMGRVEGGANSVIDALMDVITPSGTIMMPAFTFPPAELFDSEKTPTTLGVICETFRKRDDVTRSLHPTHSVAVWGKDKERYAAAHESATALGAGSPVHRLIEDGGDVLLLAVGHWANSAVHVAEAIARVPYLNLPYSDEYAEPLPVLMPDGSIAEVPPGENPGCSINFVTVEQPLKDGGFVIYHRIGDALFQRVNGRGLLRTVVGILSDDPHTLLCSWELCPFCPRARALGKS
jgi:aminoglycoside 3-N-acetyltransferase